jgi:hypothetical protein
MTVLRMCDLAHVSRAGLYRFHSEVVDGADDLDLPYSLRARLSAVRLIHGVSGPLHRLISFYQTTRPIKASPITQQTIERKNILF